MGMFTDLARGDLLRSNCPYNASLNIVPWHHFCTEFMRTVMGKAMESI